MTLSPERAIAARRWSRTTDTAEASLRAWLDAGPPSERSSRLYALESADRRCGDFLPPEWFLREAQRLVPAAIRSLRAATEPR